MILFIGLLCLLVVTFYYFFGRYNENYWKKRGVVFYDKNKIGGPQWDFMTTNQSMFEIYNNLYKTYRKEPAIGIGNVFIPGLYVINPQNIQHMLQSDFHSFNHRGIEVSEKDLLTNSVLFMHGKRWRLMRQTITPLFTGNKLRNMYYIIDKSAQEFVHLLNENPSKLKGDIFDTVTTFCSAAIGAAVFGVTTKSIFDSPFLDMIREAVAPTSSNRLRFVVANLLPSLVKTLGIKFFGDHEEFFIGAIKQIIRQREKDDTKHHDFADMCISLQKNGTLRDPETNYEIEPTDELLAAQAFFFMIAGIEPTTSSIYNCFIELGRNPDILDTVQVEIDKAFDEYNGKLTYDVVNEMEYLEKVFCEALRMYPPIGFITRKCVRDSMLPVGNIKVEKGTKLFFSIYDMHHDPEYYPNPEQFDPERFSDHTKMNEITYMPFSKGGRQCIGMRYARLQAKACLIHVLRHFTPKTTIPKGGIQFAKQQIQVRPANVKMELIPRKIKDI